MTTTSLAAFGLTRKPHVARGVLRHVASVQSDLAKLFAVRLQQEMDARGLSANALAKLSGVGQRSISRILLAENHKGRQTPSLDIVGAVARAMGIPPTWLLTAVNTAATRTPERRVVQFPQAYPSVFAAPRQGEKLRASKKKRD